MNLFSPVSEIMTTHLLTVSPEDDLSVVKEIFDGHRIHHIPVVRGGKIVGMISKTDFAHFMGGMSHYQDDKFINQNRLNHAKAKDIMVEKLGKLEPDDRINVAIEVFKTNYFHALPVVKDGELVGLVTTFDVLRALSEDMPKHPEEVYEMALHG